MYDIIKSIIEHVFTTGDVEQQYIYYICAICIPLCIIIAVDVIHCIFRSFTKMR